MKIAYISNYISDDFISQYCQGKSFSISAILKSTGIARSLMKAGNDITIFSSGLTICNCLIPSHKELIKYPEGEIKVIYPWILSYRKFSIINSILLFILLKFHLLKNKYEAVIYYNISIDAMLNLSSFSRKLKILEYEDNIFNKALKDKNDSGLWFKKWLFNYVMSRTDAAIIVGKGMLRELRSDLKVLIPGVVSEDILTNISLEKKVLPNAIPLRLLLAGGLHYSKGPDLIIMALSFISQPCELVFYGTGSLDVDAKKLIKFVPKQHTVIVKGFVNHSYLIRIMSEESHILINSTRSMGVEENSEGYPFKMIEYAAIGRPIVSSTIGRLDENFNSYVTFYDSEDPQEIAKAIITVANNYDFYCKQAQILQQKVINDYSIQGISERLNYFMSKLKKNYESKYYSNY